MNARSGSWRWKANPSTQGYKVNSVAVITLDRSPLTLPQILAVAYEFEPVSVSESTYARVDEARRIVEQILIEHRVVYGVNTGFGRLSDVKISDDELKDLQVNLVRSHSVGVGEPLSIPETRAMMLLRANVLAQGYSGARREVLDFLVSMLNERIHPVIPSRGSVGASGDLAPLAHLALAMIGEGEVWDGNGVGREAWGVETQDGGPTSDASCLTPLSLEPKEGLALLNGTQAMGSVGSLALARGLRCVHVADIAGAMTLEALMGTPTAFDERIQLARPHPGQIRCAAHLRALLEGSEIRESHRANDPRVQDAYCLRCMPQVHGGIRGALEHVRQVLEIESGSGTDNPLVFTDNGDVLSGGNFHGAPLAYALDYAAIVLTDLLSISERRMDRLVNPDTSEGLPPFLTRHAGTSSGFMMAHVTVAALLNECKVLSHPASVDSVPTSGGKEDHVSMGMTSALKLRQIVENVELGLAIELLAAAEGLEFRKPLRPGIGVMKAYEIVRSLCPPVLQDRPLSNDIEAIASAIRFGRLE
ncbi:MAG: histidine ammonia-lyase [Chlorobia bacterium]|nr:histidine ammonia-lyase [Fimbriimonadaceae bacterium]